MERLSLLSWLVIPVIATWLVGNYLVGLFLQPNWNALGSPSVMAVVDKKVKVPPYEWKGTPLITLWFDDGWSTQYSAAFPILEEYDMKGAIAITTDLVESDAYVTWPQINRMSYSGWEITSHSVDHKCGVDQMSPAGIEMELRDSQKVLEEHGYYTDIYVMPCGKYNDTLKKIAKKYYIALRYADADVGANPIPVNDLYKIRSYSVSNKTTLESVASWIETAKKENGWLIIVFHQVENTGSTYAITPEFLRQIAEMIKDNGIPVVLPSQVLRITSLSK